MAAAREMNGSSSTFPNNSTVTYYDVFMHNHGHTTAMLSTISIRAAIAICGFFLNCFLVLATIKSKKLNTFCNHLIAFDAFCLALFQLYPLITFFIVLSRLEFIPLNMCFFLLLVPQFFINVEYGVMVQIGVERLANIHFPIWSMHKKSKKIHLLLLSIYIVFCFALMALQYLELFNQTNMVLCQMSDVSSRTGLFNSIASVRTLICRSAMIIIYASIVILVKAKNLGHNETFHKDIYKSVTAIMFIEIVFWIPTTLFNKIYYLFFGFTSLEKTYFSSYLSCVSTLSGSIAAPVLFILSKNYRAAFNELRIAFLPKAMHLRRIKPIMGLWSVSSNPHQQQSPYQIISN